VRCGRCARGHALAALGATCPRHAQRLQDGTTLKGDASIFTGTTDWRVVMREA